jgi:hypothetical protein
VIETGKGEGRIERIDFRVPKKWLNEKRVSKDAVVLAKFERGKWIELSTKILREDGVFVYYSAEVSQSSIFAIIAKVAVPKPMTPLQFLPLIIVGIAAFAVILWYRHRRLAK